MLKAIRNWFFGSDRSSGHLHFYYSRSEAQRRSHENFKMENLGIGSQFVFYITLVKNEVYTHAVDAREVEQTPLPMDAKLVATGEWTDSLITNCLW